MIPTGPCRLYPYTDYHDLNLDFLLEQIRLVIIDIEDLKRRVKALEDWKEIIEGDIINIKANIRIIEGDITIIKNRIGNIEEDISEIGIIRLYDNGVTPVIYVNGESLAPSNKDLLIDYLTRNNVNEPTHISTILFDNGSTIRTLEYKCSSSENHLEATFYVEVENENYVQPYYLVINGNNITLTKQNIISNDRNFNFQLVFPTNNSSYYETISEGDYTRKYTLDLYDMNINPYRNNFHNDWYITEDDEARIYFESFIEHEDYSEYFSDFVKLEDPDSNSGPGSLGYLVIRTKDFPISTDSINFVVYVTHGNSNTL